MLKIPNKLLPFSLMLLSSLPGLAAINEEIPADEDAATRQLVNMIEESIRNQAQKGPAQRGAHPKAHGCMHAEFRVLQKLPKEFQVGLFKQTQSYPAWIRFSNSSPKAQDDSVGDGRGMAIKLMGVEQSESGTQDFLMINYPVFFVRNVTDYVDFQKAHSQDNQIKFFFPGLNPFNFRLHELKIAHAIQSTEVANPLTARYWSTTPYRFGETAMKFSARACGKTSSFVEKASRSFLRENMQKQLAHGEACFDFMVQLRKLPAEMPIEDPTLEWSEKDSPFIPVARITIPSQTFTSTDQLKFCENLSFTPWHAVPEFQPLGGINRARKTIYDTVSRVRHELNGEQRIEPTGF